MYGKSQDIYGQQVYSQQNMQLQPNYDNYNNYPNYGNGPIIIKRT